MDENEVTAKPTIIWYRIQTLSHYLVGKWFSLRWGLHWNLPQISCNHYSLPSMA